MPAGPQSSLRFSYFRVQWSRGESRLLLKTLYEVQYITVSASSYAPFKAVTTDATSGTIDYNTAQDSSNLVYPTLGLELEQAFGKRFRWGAKASGFGIPKHAAIGDMEGSLAARFGAFEISLGEKAYYFKTSPKAAEYFSDMLQAPTLDCAITGDANSSLGPK
jgi:hypothetical protein